MSRPGTPSRLSLRLSWEDALGEVASAWTVHAVKAEASGEEPVWLDDEGITRQVREALLTHDPLRARQAIEHWLREWRRLLRTACPNCGRVADPDTMPWCGSGEEAARWCMRCALERAREEEEALRAGFPGDPEDRAGRARWEAEEYCRRRKVWIATCLSPEARIRHLYMEGKAQQAWDEARRAYDEDHGRPSSGPS